MSIVLIELHIALHSKQISDKIISLLNSTGLVFYTYNADVLNICTVLRHTQALKLQFTDTAILYSKTSYMREQNAFIIHFIFSTKIYNETCIRNRTNNNLYKSCENYYGKNVAPDFVYITKKNRICLLFPVTKMTLLCIYIKPIFKIKIIKRRLTSTI